MSEWMPKSAREVPEEEWMPKSAKAVTLARPRSVLHLAKAAVDEMNPAERFASGIGYGLTNTGKNVGDILANLPGQSPWLAGAKNLGVEFLRPDREKWAEEQKDASFLTDTTSGMLGNVVGESAALLPLSMATGGAARLIPAAAKGAPFLARALPKAAQFALNALEGGGQGYVTGGPENRDTGSMMGALGNAVVGPLLSKTLGAAYRGIVKPTASALKLVKEGVKDLTMGQMAPRSALAQFEEAGTSSGLGGSILRAQRERGVDQWKDVIFNKQKPPGMANLPEGTDAERLAAAYQGFNEAYSPIKSKPIPADMGGVTMRDAMKEAFHAAAEDPRVMTDGNTRAMVEKFLQNEGTILDKVQTTPWPSSPLLASGQAQAGGPLRLSTAAAAAAPDSSALALRQANPLAKQGGIIIPPKDVIPPMRGSIPAEALMEVREGIRREAREQTGDDSAARRLLGNAEETLSDALDTHLPRDAAENLRAIDAQYRKHKVVSDAVRRAGDSPEGLRPMHLSNAVKAHEDPGKYARGGGGALRDMAAAGRDVFDARIPLTGARYLTAGPLNYVTAPIAALANMGLPKRLLTGTTKPQQLAQGVEAALQKQLAIASFLRGLRTNAMVPQRDREADYAQE